MHTARIALNTALALLPSVKANILVLELSLGRGLDLYSDLDLYLHLDLLGKRMGIGVVVWRSRPRTTQP